MYLCKHACPLSYLLHARLVCFNIFLLNHFKVCFRLQDANHCPSSSTGLQSIDYNAPSTFVHIVADNAWRRQTQFSTPLLAVGYGRDCCHLFSILAKNVASCEQSSQAYLAYSYEKRTITRSPITDSDGYISLFQLLWKGTTDILLKLTSGLFHTAA